MDLHVSDAPVGRLLDGRYRVGPRLAKGGMATVYEALDTRLDRDVALKVMHPGLVEDHDFVTRFIGEARSAARLSHPNVVAVFDQGEDDGLVYLAMELVSGRTLRQVLRSNGKLPAGTALEVMEQVLGALSAAHAAGIVHRDVKPENVLVGDDGRVKVADFGLARAVANGSTATRGVLLGTVAYISPEQALGEGATPRSDVYSAGILLWELLTGEAPHDGPTDYVIVNKHIETDVQPPSWEEPSVPPEVDRLVLAAVARDPRERFADAGAFLAALRRVRKALAADGADDPDATALLSAEPLGAAGVSAAQAMARPATGGNEVDPDARTAVIGRSTGRQEPPQAPASRRRSRKGPVAFVLVLLLALGVAAGAWWLGAGRWTSTPSMLRLELPAAEARAAEAGLSLDVAAERQFSETVPAGLVLSTDPGPGEQVLRGGTVAVVLSAGPQRFEVPTLVGLDRPAAEAALAAASLVPGEVTERYDEEVAAGIVLEQGLAPTEQAKQGTAVPFVVSLGREPIEVPAVVGRPAEEARQALEDAGFTVTSSEAYSDDVPRGAVVSQDPADGTGFRGDEVAVVVSLGPEIVEVPGVEGNGYDEAAAALERAGLVARRVELLPAGPGRVLRQDPGAGTELRRGSEVTLYTF
ncbi:MAG TPA: Stk1 family PASTA domain-containing Ser/Thr kinase [Jiangellales bacterium]|nr:Stk1 family PASTA domain-containing Ser/Thr kinase [Jiangellales bacterium]